MPFHSLIKCSDPAVLDRFLRLNPGVVVEVVRVSRLNALESTAEYENALEDESIEDIFGARKDAAELHGTEDLVLIPHARAVLVDAAGALITGLPFHLPAEAAVDPDPHPDAVVVTDDDGDDEPLEPTPLADPDGDADAMVVIGGEG